MCGVNVGSGGGSRRRKQPLRMQQCLKQSPGPARAGVVAAEFLDQLLLPAHDAVATLDAGLRREALAALARDFESKRVGRPRMVSWCSP
jgi:hypothetical protein